MKTKQTHEERLEKMEKEGWVDFEGSFEEADLEIQIEDEELAKKIQDRLDKLAKGEVVEEEDCEF